MVGVSRGHRMGSALGRVGSDFDPLALGCQGHACRHFCRLFPALVGFSAESRPNQPLRQNALAALLMEWPSALRTVALVGLTVALFRPQTASTIENMTREGIDLVLTMDLSASMLSRDFRPNRLESAKDVAMDFVDSRPFDRIGVVAYEGEAFTQVPITSDHIVVKNGLASLETGQLQGGTAIGTGLAIAVNRLRESEAESKVIVLLTDGENNAGQIEPMDAAQLAKLNGIRVYTIGVGTVGKAKSPVAIRPDGSYKYDWVDVRIDEEVLQGIASLTGARYCATNAGKLKDIYREIDTLEKTVQRPSLPAQIRSLWRLDSVGTHRTFSGILAPFVLPQILGRMKQWASIRPAMGLWCFSNS